MLDKSEVGSFIRELRQRLGLSQEGLADKLSVSLQAVKRWETDHATAQPSPYALRRMEQALHELGERGDDLLSRYFLREE